MGFVQPAPEREADERVVEMFDQDRAVWGFVPNFTRTFALRPDVYRAWQHLNTTIRSSMDRRRYELATVAAAAALRCSYCTLAHGRVLAEQFLPVEAVVELLADRAAAPLDATERAVVGFAEKVALQVHQGDIDELRAVGLIDEEIFDVILAAAARCFFAKALDASGTEPDAAFRDLDPELVEVLTVGRAIAEADGSHSRQHDDPGHGAGPARLV